MTPLEQEIIKEFVEKGANIEHERWARWQKYMFSKAQIVLGNDDEENAIQIPIEYWKHWQKEIDTPYSDLNEETKESDRKETRNYIPLLQQALKSQQERLVEEIKKHCYESEEKEQDFCALQGRIGLRNEIIEIIKKIYEQN